MNNKDITVPTIETEDGKVIIDSWDIALYVSWYPVLEIGTGEGGAIADPGQLEEKYARPAGKTLFGPSPVGENFCQFLLSYTGVALGSQLRPLVVPAVSPILPKAHSCS